MVDVVLISSSDYRTSFDYNRIMRSDNPPLGLYHLKRALSSNGITSRVINDYQDNLAPSKLIREVNESGARYIGISATGIQENSVRLLAGMLAQDTGLPIIVGGYISLLGHELMQEAKSIDVLFRGEGEVRFPRLIEALDNGRSIRGIPGLIYRKNGTLVDTGRAPRIKDISMILPDFSYIDETEEVVRMKLQSSRGCPNNCSFCDIPNMYNGSGRRYMSTDLLVETVEELYLTKGIGMISFNDDNFPIKRVLPAIGPVLRKYGIKLNFQVRATDVLKSKAMIRKYSDVIAFIEVGLESFSQSQLDRWNKKTTREQNLETMAVLHDAKITPSYNLMFADDETTREELRKNLLTFVSAIHKNFPLGLLNAFDSNHFPLMNPMGDVRGHSNLPDYVNQVDEMLRTANRQLNLADDFFRAKDNEDREMLALIYYGAQSLILTTVQSLDEDEAKAEKAIERHDGLRILLNSLGTFEAIRTDDEEIARRSMIQALIAKFEQPLKEFGYWE